MRGTGNELCSAVCDSFGRLLFHLGFVILFITKHFIYSRFFPHFFFARSRFGFFTRFGTIAMITVVGCLLCEWKVKHISCHWCSHMSHIFNRPHIWNAFLNSFSRIYVCAVLNTGKKWIWMRFFFGLSTKINIVIFPQYCYIHSELKFHYHQTGSGLIKITIGRHIFFPFCLCSKLKKKLLNWPGKKLKCSICRPKPERRTFSI